MSRYNKNNKLIEKTVNKNTILKGCLYLKNEVLESMSEYLGGEYG